MELAPATIARLIETAREAQTHAHAPYSHFPVGAAVLAEDGRVFPGCNVENGSYGLTICAERNAVAAAIVAGARPVAVAVVANRETITPCGACRQVLSEFSLDMPVILASAQNNGHRVTSVEALLPGAFRFDESGEPNR